MAAEDDPDLAWTRDTWADMRAGPAGAVDRKGNTMRVASAPVSFGIFELTADDAGLPDPVAVLDAMVDAGYEGTELGPPGYFGDAPGTAAALTERGLSLVVVPADAAVPARAHGRGLRLPRRGAQHPRRDHPETTVSVRSYWSPTRSASPTG